MGKRIVWTALAVVLGGGIYGCSDLDLGPEPSNYVGNSAHQLEPLTDRGLQAVTPAADAAAVLSVATMPAAAPAGAATNPRTTPAASGPAPGTNPASAPATSVLGHAKSPVPMALTLQETILTGLQNNVNLRVQRYNVPISRTAEQAALGAFDPTISGQVTGSRTATPSQQTIVTPGSGGTSTIVGGTTTSKTVTRIIGQANGQVGIQEYLPTGTTLSANYSSDNVFYSDANASSTISGTVTQRLLKGFSLDVNLASLRQAELATKLSQYELRSFAESLVANIEETYWDVVYDQQQVGDLQNALDLAQAQLDQTHSLINVGRVAPTEQAAAQAQVELEKEDLINAKSTLESDRIKLLQYITPAGQPFWDRTLTLQTPPFVPTGTMDPVDRHAAVALQFRPEINEAKLQIQSGNLTVVQTKNGLLPELDFFLTLDKTGYSASFTSSNVNINGPGYEAIVGISGSYPIQNLAARAAYRAATLTREQLGDTLNNLYQTVQVDVRTAYIEVERSREQIDATRAARESETTSLQVEQAKFQAGRSTSLLVAQAQQLLLSAQLTEVQAVTAHLKALVELYRLEGSLLYRRGLDAPGALPVRDRAWR